MSPGFYFFSFLTNTNRYEGTAAAVPSPLLLPLPSPPLVFWQHSTNYIPG